ncbi:MAG TPA: hypothetical protein VGJ86_05300 [Acidimicrobiales bacterium]
MNRRTILTKRPDEADTAETERVVDKPTDEATPTEGRRWFRRTVTVPMTVPERSLRRTMRIPSRRIQPQVARPGLAPAPILAVVAGGALAVVGLVALMRAGVNDTWYRPTVEVLDANHTPLLGAIELAAGVFVLLLGLTGSRLLVAMAGIAGSLVATAAAVDPTPLQRELAIESWWAWVLAGVGVALTLAALQEPRIRQPDTIVDVR